MAGFSEKIRILFDIDEKGATGPLGKIRTAVHDADGAFGKAKAGASGLSSTIKDNLGAAAIAGGAALVAFGVKAVTAFTDTAKAALDLGAATGLSEEQASRWIAVGDDMGVSAETLTSTLGKVAKTLDEEKWSKYGIATRDAAGNAKDTNDILLQTFSMLGKIENETERARVGNELFGRGYAQLAPLIGKTRKEYEGMLGAVEDGQVITEKEAAKAEKMRLAQDALKDALQDVTLAVGGMVAEMAPAIDGMASAVEKALEWKEALGPIPDAIAAISSPLTVVDKVTSTLGHDIDLTAVSLEQFIIDMKDAGFEGAQLAEMIQAWHTANGDLTSSLDTTAESTADLSKEQRDEADAAEKASRATEELSKDVRDDADAMALAASETRDLDAAYRELTGQLSEREAWLNLLDSLDEYAYKLGAGTLSSREAEQATIDIRQELIGYLAKLDDVPAMKQTEILSLIDQGRYDEVKAMLDQLAAPRTVSYTPTGDSRDRTGARAGGGPVEAGGSYMVGERGPEVVTFGADGYVTPNDKIGQGAGGQPVVNHWNITVNSDPRQVLEIMRRARRNGMF